MTLLYWVEKILRITRQSFSGTRSTEKGCHAQNLDDWDCWIIEDNKMSYATKYTRSKVEQMNTSINAAAQMIDDEVEADKFKRKMLMDQITQFDANLVEYRKALAEFDIMPEDDPALARQKVIQKSGTRVVAGSSSASSDALILGAIKHQTEYLMDLGNASKKFIESDFDQIDKVLGDAQINLDKDLEA